MAWSKAKIAAACVVGLVLVGGAGVVVHRTVSSGGREVVITPGATATVTSVSPVDGFAVRGRVVSADGKPVKGAKVLAATGPGSLVLYHDPQFSYPPERASGMTGQDGNFAFKSPESPRGVVVSCEEGFARATLDQLGRQPTLQLIPWGRIEGTVNIDGVPAAGAQVLIAFIKDEPRFQITIAADDSGRIVVPKAPTGRLYMSCWPKGMASINGMINVSSGKTSSADFSTRNGHIVVAHLASSVKSGQVTALLNLEPQPPSDSEIFAPSAYQADIDAHNGGVLQFAHIPPGDYRISLSVLDPTNFGGWVAQGKVHVPSDTSREVDAGIFEPKPQGQSSPAKGPPAQ